MIRLLHLADIHIGTKFSNKREDVRKILKKSVLKAFESSVNYAIREKLDCVLIAGDLFDGGEIPFQGEFGFLSLIERLEKSNINVFYTTGNHDPYKNNDLFERLKTYKYIHPFYRSHPETVSIVTASGETLHVTSAGHDQPSINENIIKDFPSKFSGGIHIGIGHTMVAAVSGKVEHGNYMPCTLEDLKSKGYDYFALGHIHKSMTLDDEERIRYAGNIQGRHYKETGSKGGYLVELSEEYITSKFIPFHEVEWLQKTVGLTKSSESVYDVVKAVEEALGDEIPQNIKWIGRVHLEGESPLFHRLRQGDELEALEETLIDRLDALDISVKISDLKPVINRDALKGGEHFLGAFLTAFDNDSKDMEKYLDTVEFISDKGNKDRESFVEECIKKMDERLISKMKK